MAKQISKSITMGGPMGVCEYALFDWEGVIWTAYLHPSGGWVSLREATSEDRAAFNYDKEFGDGQ